MAGGAPAAAKPNRSRTTQAYSNVRIERREKQVSVTGPNLESIWAFLNELSTAGHGGMATGTTTVQATAETTPTRRHRKPLSREARRKISESLKARAQGRRGGQKTMTAGGGGGQ